MIAVLVNEQQLNNLKVFLERVDLKGSEVPAYVDIVNAVNNAELKEKDPNTNKPDDTQ